MIIYHLKTCIINKLLLLAAEVQMWMGLMVDILGVGLMAGIYRAAVIDTLPHRSQSSRKYVL